MKIFYFLVMACYFTMSAIMYMAGKDDWTFFMAAAFLAMLGYIQVTISDLVKCGGI